jgi:hypothetical protein
VVGGAERLFVEAGIVGVDGTHEAAADVAELALLGLGERVEDPPSHLGDVARCGCGDFGPPGVGQDREAQTSAGGSATRPGTSCTATCRAPLSTATGGRAVGSGVAAGGTDGQPAEVVLPSVAVHVERG